MLRLSFLFVALLFLGCSGPTFTNLGNGVAVPSQSIDEYAAANGLRRAEARAQMRQEADRERIEEHAEKYGVSVEEAKTQVEYADGNAAQLP